VVNSTFILPTAHEAIGSNLGMSNYSLPPYGILIESSWRLHMEEAM